eukprot:2794777-Rhodomonas_salina.4
MNNICRWDVPRRHTTDFLVLKALCSQVIARRLCEELPTGPVCCICPVLCSDSVRGFQSRHLTSDQVDHFKEAFQLFDVDGGGSIDVDELGALMRFLGHNLSEKELGDMVERWDTSGTDTINVEGFLSASWSSSQAVCSGGWLLIRDAADMLASYSDVVDVEETMLAGK